MSPQDDTLLDAFSTAMSAGLDNTMDQPYATVYIDGHPRIYTRGEAVTCELDLRAFRLLERLGKTVTVEYAKERPDAGTSK